MAEVATLLEQEMAKAPKERFYARKPPYPLRILSKPYPKRYEPQVFAQYDGKKGSAVEHVSKFIDTLGPYAVDKEETPVRGALQNAGQRFITMTEVAALLKQKKVRAPKERFYA